MINLKLNNLKKLVAAGVFALALFMPVILCGCGDKKEGDELLLGMEAESETQLFTHSYEEKSDAAWKVWNRLKFTSISAARLKSRTCTA